MRVGWNTQLKANDVLVFVRLPAGGGGGGGSNPLKIVAMIALTYFTMGAGAGWIGTTFGVGAKSFAAHAIGAGLFMAGSALVNAVLPDEAPQINNANYDPIEASPTYSANNQGNQARIDKAIPVVFGEFKVFPDFATQPYSEYIDNKQYLYQIFCIGQGDYEVGTLFFGGTNANRFNDIDINYYQQGSLPSAFDDNIVSSTEIQGQKIDSAIGEYPQTITYTATENVINNLDINLFITSGKLKLSLQTDGGAEVSHYIELPTSSGVTNISLPNDFNIVDNELVLTAQILDAKGYSTSTILDVKNDSNIAFNANYELSATTASTTNVSSIKYEINQLVLDITAPRGLYYSRNDGGLNALSAEINVKYKLKSDTVIHSKNYVLDKNSTGEIGLTANTALRWTKKIDVPLGVYEVWVERVDVEQTSARYGHEIRWGAHRGRVPSRSLTNTNNTYVAVKALVTEQLAETSSRRANFIVKSKIKKYDGTNWVDGGNSNPVWIAADIIKNNLYGAGLDDTRFNLVELKTLADECDSENLEFNGTFDNTISIAKALETVCKTARATAIWQAGKLRIVRDKPQTIASAFFGMDNIIKDSFSMSFVMPNDITTNAVKVDYIDANDWNNKSVRADSGIAPKKEQTIKYLGCTSEAQAQEYANYLIAANKYRRHFISFDTGMEGYIPAYNDLILVSHEVLKWTTSGSVIAWDSATKTLTTNITLPSSMVDYYINVRNEKGEHSSNIAITKLTDTTMQLAIDPGLNFDIEQEQTNFAIGTLDNINKRVQVISIKPKDLHTITISGVVYDDRVYI
jgi:hypothetical protein